MNEKGRGGGRGGLGVGHLTKTREEVFLLNVPMMPFGAAGVLQIKKPRAPAHSSRQPW